MGGRGGALVRGSMVHDLLVDGAIRRWMRQASNHGGEEPAPEERP
jgi:hypothetical protein